MNSPKYRYSDFLTKSEWNVRSKLDYYDIVVPKNGGWGGIKEIKDQIYRQYKFDKYVAKRMWKKWAIRRSKDAIYQLTGLPIDSKEVKALHQNLAEQFKNRFDDIYEGYGKFQETSSSVFEKTIKTISEEESVITMSDQLSELMEFMNLKCYSSSMKDSIIKTFVSSATF